MDKDKPEQEQGEEFITMSNPGPKAPELETVMEIPLTCCKPLFELLKGLLQTWRSLTRSNLT